MSVPQTENNYCRKCGSKLNHSESNLYVCSNNHKIYVTSPPAVALILFNENNEIALITRAIEPGLGKSDFPGGFCDYGEDPVESLYREIKEEIGLDRNSISNLRLLHTGVDPYAFGGEIIEVISIIYEAKCSGISLKAMDDVATASFLHIDKVSIEDIFFPSLKEAFVIIRDREKHA